MIPQHPETGAHIHFGDPEVRLPVDTPEQIAAAKCALSDAGVHFVSVRQANGYHNGATIWADEATWRGYRIYRDGDRCFIERDGVSCREIVGVCGTVILGDIRCEIDRIEDAET